MPDEHIRPCPTVAALPKGWHVKSLGSFCTKIGTGATPRGGSEVYLKSRLRHALIRSQNVFDRHFDPTGLAFISPQHAAELRNAEIEANDILLNITGDGITFGRSCIVPTGIMPACVNQHVSIIRPDPRECVPGYLLSVLTHPAAKHYIESFNSGGSRRAITKGHIESFRIPLPSLPTQKAIAHILGTLDDKIELNRRMNQTLEAIAQAIFKEWFVDPAKDELPKGWRTGRLDDIVVLQRGFDLPNASRTPGPYPVLCASGPSGTHGHFMVRGPGVTTGRSGVLGRVYYVHEDFWPHNTSLWVKEFKHATPIFAYHLLRELRIGAYNAGSAVPTLNRNHVHNLLVTVPPINLINEFEERAKPLFDRLRSNSTESRTLAQLRDTLLPKLLSGELSIKDAEKFLEVQF